uniref:Uncharacterized protein n=1 Tax=Romanomermis culicivorax TaxID=13658 RepID=A0A915KLA2_ROMCU
MDSEKSIDFLAKFTNFVMEKRSNDVFELIFDSENENYVIFNAMDLITFLCDFLNGNFVDDQFFDVSSQILEHVIKIGKSKEILLAFIEFLNDKKLKDDQFFDLITRLLKITFLRLPDQQLDSLEFILCKFYDHVTKFEFENDDYDQQEFDSNVVENDQEFLISENWPSKKMLHYENSLKSTLNFLEIFVSELKNCQIIKLSKFKNEKIKILTSILLQFLSNPIIYFNLNTKIRSEKWFLVEKCVNFIYDLHPNGIFKIIEFPMLKFDHFAIGLLIVLVYCSQICQNRQPNVYSQDYIFRTCLVYCNALLQYDDEFFWRSGLKLCKFLLQYEHVDYSHNCSPVFINLIKIMSETRSRIRRQESYDVFWQFLRKIDSQIQISIFRKIFYCMGQNCFNEKLSTQILYGIRGSIIDFYKWNLRINVQNRQNIFWANLRQFLPKFCQVSLLDDILDQQEQIAACLNLFIFLNLNGDFNYNDQIDRYLENLKQAIDECKKSIDCDFSLCKLQFLSSLCDRLSEINNR